MSMVSSMVSSMILTCLVHKNTFEITTLAWNKTYDGSVMFQAELNNSHYFILTITQIL